MRKESRTWFSVFIFIRIDVQFVLKEQYLDLVILVFFLNKTLKEIGSNVKKQL